MPAISSTAWASSESDNYCDVVTNWNYSVVAAKDGGMGIHVEMRMPYVVMCARGFASVQGITSTLTVWVERSTDNGQTWSTAGICDWARALASLQQDAVRRSPRPFTARACAALSTMAYEFHPNTDTKNDGIKDVNDGEIVCTDPYSLP